MIDRFIDLAYFIQNELYALTELNFNQIYYSDIRTSLTIGSLLLLLVIVKLGWYGLRRHKNIQKYSGTTIDRNYLQGFILKFLSLVPRLVFTLAVVGILMALSNPILNQIVEDKKIIESRIRIDLRDVSTSMEQLATDPEISKAQVAAETHLEFLKMRIGKNDRVSYWIFAGNTHMVEDFIIDDQLYFQQVEDSPWIIFGGNLEEFFEHNPNFRISKEKYASIFGDSGGTNMRSALSILIEYFDQDERRLRISGTDVSNIKRSILIITDADVHTFPDDELNKLRVRNITPYIILIKNPNQVNTPVFAKRIQEYGGKFFDASDATGLSEAFEAIDRFETVEVEVTRKIFKFLVFQKFILISVLIMALAMLVGLIFAPFEVYP